MKRIAFIVPVLLLAVTCAAQQPDIRVRLLTLYRLDEVDVEPTAGTTVVSRLDTTCRDFGNKFTVSARNNSLEMSTMAGTKLRLEGDVRIVSDKTPPQHIRGVVEMSAQDGTLRIIASIPVEQYVADVLQGEAAADTPEEALKASAVAIRSYTTRFRERHKEDGFDFCDTTHCQYLRLEPGPAALSAVKQTEGQLLWDRGRPLAAYYHKDCGGQTEAAAAVWPDQRSRALVSHEDPYCFRSERPWRSEITRADLDRAVAAAGLRVPIGWDRIVIAERTSSGRARTLRFSVGSGQQGMLVSASTLRFAVGRALGWSTLKSDLYEVTIHGDHFVFSGKGVGHGVGLCQAGAAEMARQGKTYREILAFYYPSAIIGRSAQGVPWKELRTDRFELKVVNEADARIVRGAAHEALEWASQRSGLSLNARPTIEVYPTVEMFRDATGEPGWIAASTKKDRLRLQPVSVLGGTLLNVLRHEFLHMLIEGNANANTPLWFREGLVVYLGGDPPAADEVQLTREQMDHLIQTRPNDKEMRSAYAQAAALVRELDRKYGRARLIEWLRSGLPANIRTVAPFPGTDKVPQ